MLAIAALLLSIAVIVECNQKKTGSVSTAGNTKDSIITPVDLKVVVPGFNFPEDSTKILGWLNQKPVPAVNEVYKHAWGIWAGLTAQSGETYQGDSLLVYQTWTGINELVNLTQQQNGFKLLRDNKAKSHRTLLSIPEQFKRARLENVNKKKLMNSALNGTINDSAVFFVGVSYSPASAAHTLKYSLLKESVQNSYKKAGQVAAIPPFPNNGVNIKPVYYIGKKTDSLIRIPAWPGEPSTPKAFAPTDWNNYVYADVRNQQPKNKKLVPATGSNPTQAQIAAATCNVSDFIYYKIDSLTAAYLNQQQGANSFSAGDLAILVAMHVTTKEISNWTWQTFFWSPNANLPQLPSNAAAAALRPAQLSAAAAHYALSTAYAMVYPNQPVTGGQPGKVAVIGYNPYLEAGFDPSTFSDYPNTWKPNFRYGIQTNCMSCHALASQQNVTGKGENALDIYCTDQYIDMGGSKWVNKVQLDFAWSLRDNAIADTKSKK